MKIFLWVLGIIVLYVIIELAVFYYRYQHLPELKKPDQSERVLGSGPALRYVAAGDSTSVGEGASGVENTYTYKIAQELANANTVNYKNVGVIGAQTADVLQKQLVEIIAFKPDIITISIGGNDATHLVSAQNIIANEKNIIAQLKAQTSATIYLTNIPNFHGAGLLPWFYIQLLEYRSKSLDKQIIALEDDRVKIVNIHDFGWSEEPYKDRGKTYAADHFHPNDLGYQNWTNAFLGRIK